MIFISHSSLNSEEAARIRDWLVGQGWGHDQIFLALDDLSTGDRWRQRLNHIGATCEAVIVCLSDDWLKSSECLREFNHAESRGKPIFPVQVAAIIEKIPGYVRELQTSDITPNAKSDGFAKLRTGLLAARIGPEHFRWPPDGEANRSPYRGLQPLEQMDAAVLFGRDAAITRGLDTLRCMRQGTPERILVVLGASGAGKSSFLRAGLLSRLARDELGFSLLPVLRPEQAALTGSCGLCASLDLDADSAITAKTLLARVRHLHSAAEHAPSVAHDQEGTQQPTLVLPIDQGEEFFAAENAEGERALGLLCDVLREDGNTVAIVTIRSDSYERLQRVLQRHRAEPLLFDLPTMSPGAFKQVIEGPGQLMSPKIEFEAALSDQLVEDLEKGSALPLLAFTLERLVDRYADDHRLELSEYTRGMGGLSGAIEDAVESALAAAEREPKLPNNREDLEALTRRAFIPWLVQVNAESSVPKRRRARRDDLPEDSRVLVDCLVEQRLLHVYRPDNDGVREIFVEVTHEAVLYHWPQLSNWLEDEASNLLLLDNVKSAARDWLENGRPPEWLAHTGRRLIPANRLLSNPLFSESVSPETPAYLAACEGSRRVGDRKESRRTIFLGQSSENNAQTLALAQWLEMNGWTDPCLDISKNRGLTRAEQWQSELRISSHRCKAVVFLISRAWIGSKWCFSDFLLARELGMEIIGVLVEEIPIGELSHKRIGACKLYDLVEGDVRIVFDVEREPFLPLTRVELPETGLSALQRGLQKAGVLAFAFPWPPVDQPGRAPYRGLSSYEAIDAAVFFGRDAAIERGLDQVRDTGIDRLLVILGPKGTGKSSFMRAGLLPRLKHDDRSFYVLPVIRPARSAISGGEGLVNSLHTAFSDLGVNCISLREMRNRFTDNVNGEVLFNYVQQLRDMLVAQAAGDKPEPTIILPIDQGEELYANDGAEEAAQLRAQLACLLQRHHEPSTQRHGSNLLAVVSIRTDHYQHLQNDTLLQQIGRKMIDLTQIDQDEYRRIIEGPAERATEGGKELVFEPALTDRLLIDAQGADALPMLAFILERLYTGYGDDGYLTVEKYQQLGGVSGWFTAAINAAMESPQKAPVIPVDKVEQLRLLRQAFIPWLVEIDDRGERRRRVAYWDELPPETQPMLERFTKERLLVRNLPSSGDGVGKREVIEVAHEALLRCWSPLAMWLNEDADALRAIGPVSDAATQWEQNNRNDDYLIHAGERLRNAEALLGRPNLTECLKKEGCAYLVRCRAVENARKAELMRRQEYVWSLQRRLRVFAVTAAMLAIGASGAVGWVYLSSQKTVEVDMQMQRTDQEKRQTR